MDGETRERLGQGRKVVGSLECLMKEMTVNKGLCDGIIVPHACEKYEMKDKGQDPSG